MDKISILIDPEDWGNLVTKYEPHSKKFQDSDFSAGTVNLATDFNGSLSKRKGLTPYNSSLLAAPTKDLYESVFSDGARHLLAVCNGVIKYSTGDGLFHSVTNGTGFSTLGNFEFVTVQDRAYGCNGIDQPIVYDRQTSYGGSAPIVAPYIKQMGLLAPSTAPVATTAASGAVPAGLHNYRVTFVYYDSEESNPGPQMASPINVTAGQRVNLTSVPLGGYGVTQRNIYRDDNNNVFTLVGYIADNTTTTFSDTVAIGPTPLPLEDFNVPVPIFGEARVWLSRIWLSRVVGEPNILFYSETSEPDVFFAENQVICNEEDPITATVVYFDRLMVFNRRSMGQIVGDTPETFRYSAIPSSVGCVDNRTLQTHVLHGVPVLIWLSERGFYTYDGNAINYVSDPIEDLVNYNIRQASQQKGSNTQTSFTSGVATDGFDPLLLSSTLKTRGYDAGTSAPGSNPRRDWNDSSDWNLASSQTNTKNLDTSSGLNHIAYHNLHQIYEPIEGTATGDITQQNQGYVDIATTPNDPGRRNGTGGTSIMTSATYTAQPITMLRAGTITQVLVQMAAGIPYNSNYHKFKITVWENSGGNPGTILAQGPITQVPTTVGIDYTLAVSIPRATGQTIWVGVEHLNPTSGYSAECKYTSNTTFSGAAWIYSYSGPWTVVGGTNNHINVAYTYTSTPVARSGTYESRIYDNLSNCTRMVYWQADENTPNVWGGTKTKHFYVYGSNDQINWTQLLDYNGWGQTIANVDHLGYRYFKYKITISVSDDRDQWHYQQLYYFPANADWTSETIDCTSDITTLALAYTHNSSYVTLQIATNTVDSGWGGSGNAPGQFGPAGSAIPRKYARVKLTWANYYNDDYVTNITLNWTIVSTYTSAVIDTAVAPPPGWDVFASQFTTFGGTVQFQMAAGPLITDPGTPSYPYTVIVPGNLPSITPYQYVKVRVIVTSTNNAVPVVDSFTVQWFVTQSESVRPASIFDNGRYYVSLADSTSSVNNLILQLDLNGKWRRFSNMSVATMSFFFNRPYVGMATNGQVSRFLEGFTDNGVNIPLDIRTKAFDFNSGYRDVSEKLKIPLEVFAHIKNTGATLYFYYSVDDGITFQPLYMLDGTDHYHAPQNQDDYWIRLKPSWSQVYAGSHLMFRIYNEDDHEVEVLSIKATAMVRNQPPVIIG